MAIGAGSLAAIGLTLLFIYWLNLLMESDGFARFFFGALLYVLGTVVLIVGSQVLAAQPWLLVPILGTAFVCYLARKRRRRRSGLPARGKSPGHVRLSDSAMGLACDKTTTLRWQPVSSG